MARSHLSLFSTCWWWPPQNAIHTTGRHYFKHVRCSQHSLLSTGTNFAEHAMNSPRFNLDPSLHREYRDTVTSLPVQSIYGLRWCLTRLYYWLTPSKVFNCPKTLQHFHQSCQASYLIQFKIKRRKGKLNYFSVLLGTLRLKETWPSSHSTLRKLLSREKLK